MRSGTSPPSVISTGAPTGAATSEPAAIPAGQSAASTRVTASGPAAPPAEGKTASATAAASAIGSAPAIRVVFLVANAGKPRSVGLLVGRRHLADHDLGRRRLPPSASTPSRPRPVAAKYTATPTAAITTIDPATCQR